MRLYKDTHNTHSFFTLSLIIMSKSVLLSLLAQGNNGNEILQILDTIAADADDSVEENVEF